VFLPRGPERPALDENDENGRTPAPRFLEAEVLELLEERFDGIEAHWDADPYREATTWALLVKEFMRARGILGIHEGCAAFKRFKSAQADELSRAGLRAAPLSLTGRSPANDDHGDGMERGGVER